MKNSHNNGNWDNDLEVEKRAKALKRDWNKLTDAQRFSRIYEISKLGCSNRRLAKEIGVSDKTIGNCLNKHQGKKVAAGAMPRKSPRSGRNESAEANTNPVVEQAKQTPEPPLSTDAEKAILRKKSKKLNLAALDPKPEPAIPSKPEPTVSNRRGGHTSISQPGADDPIKPLRDTRTAGEVFLDGVYERVHKQMAEQHRINLMDAEAMRDPLSRGN